MSEQSRMRILVFISFLVFHSVFASSQNEKILTSEVLLALEILNSEKLR